MTGMATTIPSRFRELVGRACLMLVLAIAVAAVAGGCSGGRRGVELVRISGRLTCDQGPMPAAGQMVFVPRQGAPGATVSRPLRPGSATFAVDGAFRATSWTPGDGLVPGTYAVVVDCWKVPPTMDGPPAVSLIGQAYGAAETTPLELVVPVGSGPLEIAFDLVRRP
jgi:hypothetical protein